MTTRLRKYRQWMYSGFLILVGMFFSVAVLADAPVLVIEPDGSSANQFLVDEIESITFSDAALIINGWDGWLNERSLGSIQEIRVRWLIPSGIPDHDAPMTDISDGTLMPNRPNPFVNATTIAYTIPQNCSVDLSIYSVTGRKITTLVRGQKPAGLHRTEWDGCDQSGKRILSGVYFYRLETPTNTESRRLVLINH